MDFTCPTVVDGNCIFTHASRFVILLRNVEILSGPGTPISPLQQLLTRLTELHFSTLQSDKTHRCVLIYHLSEYNIHIIPDSQIPGIFNKF